MIRRIRHAWQILIGKRNITTVVHTIAEGTITTAKSITLWNVIIKCTVYRQSYKRGFDIATEHWQDAVTMGRLKCAEVYDTDYHDTELIAIARQDISIWVGWK